LNSVMLWGRAAALAWAAAAAILLLTQVRFTERWIPDWLRTLSRWTLLVVTVGVVVLGVLLGTRYFKTAVDSQQETAAGAPLDISFSSVDAFLLSLYLSMNQEQLNTPAGTDPTPLNFVVASGETAGLVGIRLQEQGLVTNSELFRRYMSYKGLDVSLKAGSYSLRANMTIPEVAQALQSGSADTITVTIPEGWRAEQVGWLLEQQGLMRSDDFLALVRTGRFGYSWLAGRPPGASLEGFLFPDTYQLAADATPEAVIELMLATFDTRVAPEIEGRLSGKRVFDLTLGDYRPLTLYDVLIVASIVEREAVVAEERAIIASVYFNRLDPAYVNETALRLSSDPTIQYAKGLDPEKGTWWNPMLPGEGQTLDSPYNTFKIQGLPPGPICSPGLASVLAVLNPADTTYLYFHAKGDGSGTHAFASTLEEHQENQQQYTP